LLNVNLGQTQILDTFAEAFRMRYVRLLVTAHDEHWLREALQAATGYASSIIACDAEAGLERICSTEETPDGRPGAALLLFGFSKETLAPAVANRVGQSIMTCPTTAVFDGLPEAAERIPLGKQIRYFGDGYQKSKQLAGRRYWRVPVMDGEFLVQESVGVEKGIGGGNLILQATDLESGLAAMRRAVAAVAPLPGVIAPFPGGVARSGSKVGSRYKKLKASTADAYCPTLRGRVTTSLQEGVNCCYEIVLDGSDEDAIGSALAQAMRAAAGAGVVAIGAGNYGGKLGKFHFHLRQLLQKYP
jgi:formylmethanofuran--tetrahydromethanopterin N-formyltransferase